jgi:membrane protease YdiL (CAAX protease family)
MIVRLRDRCAGPQVPMTGTAKRAASLTGLAIAWGGTALLISPAAGALGDPARLQTALIVQALLWILAVAVVAIVLFWEKQPLASLWLKPFRWQSIGWALVLLVVNYAVVFPVSEWVRGATGLSGFSQGMEQVMRFPFAFRLLGVIGAGVVEELLFRGFTVTRLTALTGRTWLAGALTVVGFSLLHVPVWGWGFALIGLIGGAASTAFFIWRKDLLAMMVFHAITDAMGFLITPMFSEWWREPWAL